MDFLQILETAACYLLILVATILHFGFYIALGVFVFHMGCQQ